MLRKLWPRERAFSDAGPLEACLEETLFPVSPRPEFVAALRKRLESSAPRLQRRAEASSAAPLTGLGAALGRYTSAQVTLHSLRLWRVLLAAVIFLLGGGHSLAESKS